MKLMHATCVHIDGSGLLLCGPSGCGKSDLAARLIEYGARLVSDDYVYVDGSDGQLYAIAPAEIAGKIEIRGVGIVTRPYSRVASIVAVINLGAEPVERLPSPGSVSIDNVEIPEFQLNPFEPSACAKISGIIEILGSSSSTAGDINNEQSNG